MNEKEKSDTLQLLGQFARGLPKRGRVWIIPHDYPDPDALASAAALHLILSHRFNLKPLIGYTGQVSRAENRELVRHIPFRLAATSSFRSKRNQIPTFFVDTAPWTANVTIPDSSSVLGVIDHHPVPKSASLENVPIPIICPEVGATATLMSDLLEVADVPVPTWLATILVYAIATETLDLHREVNRRDLDAYTLRITQSNLSILGRIRHAPLPRSYFHALQEGITAARLYGRISWTVLQEVEKPEMVAEIADLLLRIERVSWSFCMAGRGDRLLVSIRSCQQGARCGKLLARVIGKKGKAGGHGSMAAGYVALSDTESIETAARSLAERLIQQIEIRRRKSVGGLDMEGQPLVPPSSSSLQKSPFQVP